MKKGLLERFRSSFGFRLFLAYTVFVFIISVSFIAFFIHHQRRFLTEKMVKSGQLLAEILAYNSRLGVFSESDSLLKIPVEGMIRQESVLAVWVYNQDGKLLKSEIRPQRESRGASGLSLPRAEEFFRQMRLSLAPLDVDRENEFEFWSPVMSGSASTTVESLYFESPKIGERDRVVGFVGLSMEKDRLRRQLQEQLFTSLGIGLLFLLASCAITYLLTRTITGPLYRLNRSVTLLGEKSPMEDVPVETADEVGKLAGAINVMADSLRKRENALRESQEKLAGILGSLPDCIFMVDEENNILWANEVAIRLFGQKLLESKCYQVLHSYEWECASCPARQTFQKGGIHEIETELALDGKKLIYWVTASVASRHREGTPKSVILIARDITQQKLYQAEAMQANRLAGLGELSAGLAHEINNPINGIINYAQILADLADAADGGAEEAEIPKRIIREGERIANIVQSLLSFARGSPREKGSIPIRRILEDSLILVESHLKKGDIRLEVAVPEDLPPVLANGHQIQQVFLNVISNARYALFVRFPNGSPDKRMRIEASRLFRNGKKMVRTVFLDLGTGIPEKLLDRICDPFFSTKPPGVGTGLGLSISLGIVKDHGGVLSFESREGEYTKVIIDLPAFEGPSEIGGKTD